jgi:hypothetical protein
MALNDCTKQEMPTKLHDYSFSLDASEKGQKCSQSWLNEERPRDETINRWCRLYAQITPSTF